MGLYLKKIVSGLIGVYITLSLCFFALRFLPGGPFSHERALSPHILVQLNKKYGLDQPLWEQYFRWLKEFVSFDFGVSLVHQDLSILELISNSFLPTLTLGFSSMVVALTFGSTVGLFQATTKRVWLRRGIGIVQLGLLSLPSYFIASLFILFLALRFQFLPSGLWDSPKHAILPIATLSLKPMAQISQYLSQHVGGILREPFLLVAQAKGVGKFSLRFRHLYPHAILPVFPILGTVCADLITGSFVVESIFQIPGLGKLLLQSIFSRDYSLTLTMIALYACILLTLNLFFEVLGTWVDPRTRDENPIHRL